MIYQKTLIKRQDSPNHDLATVLMVDEVRTALVERSYLLTLVKGPFGMRALRLDETGVAWQSKVLEWLFSEPITAERFLTPDELSLAKKIATEGEVDEKVRFYE